MDFNRVKLFLYMFPLTVEFHYLLYVQNILWAIFAVFLSLTLIM